MASCDNDQYSLMAALAHDGPVHQRPQRVIAGEDPARTSSSAGSRSRASMKAVSRAWPSSTTRPPPGPVVTRISGGNRAPSATAFAMPSAQSLATPNGATQARMRGAASTASRVPPDSSTQ